MAKKKLFDRELSWLQFNHRVLQEAGDPDVPLLERIKFLAIFSSNLDEFFRVRVASLRSLLSLPEKSQKKIKFDPAKLLKKIHHSVNEHQEEFGYIYQHRIKPGLDENGIIIPDETNYRKEHKEFLQNYFDERIVPQLQPMLIVGKKIKTFLKNSEVYLAVRLYPKVERDDTKKHRHRYAVMQIPVSELGRFVQLPEIGGKTYVMFLDDVIRIFMDQVFPGYQAEEIYSVKLTRDAELYIDDEFAGNLLDKIKKSLSRRSTGVPSRFLYDKNIPKDFLKVLKRTLHLKKEDMVPGGRYHNYSDFFTFPDLGRKDLEYTPLPPVRSETFDKGGNVFKLLREQNVMLYFPCHSYRHVIELLEEAAKDNQVTDIRITLYRVAKGSAVVKALTEAVERGKTVTAFIEVKARFDEESNIDSGEELEKAGAKVLYSIPGIKVHSKICLITRKESGGKKRYAYLGTGNFNEKTARVYTDFGYFTSDERLTGEVKKVINLLTKKSKKEKFNHLMVAGTNLREGLNDLIDAEIANAKRGLEAKIIMKLNAVEDPKMIKKLYEASKAGVMIRMIVRGICCLIPGAEGMSENIEITSIVDRFLEHARVYIFHNGGNEKYYVSSADLMKRNLNRRIEVCFPVNDDESKQFIRRVVDYQLNDNVKARIIDKNQTNTSKDTGYEVKVRAQTAIYGFIKSEEEPPENVSAVEV